MSGGPPITPGDDVLYLFNWLKSDAQKDQDARAERIYQVINGQAREPYFFTDLGVEDTMDGRFDLVVLHAFLFIERTKSEGAEAKAISQIVFDRMFRAFDVALRESGVGDISVGKKIKKMGQAFYGRAKAYDDALTFEETGEAVPDPTKRVEEGEAPPEPETLPEVLMRNVYRGREGAEGDAERMAQYVRKAMADLRAQPLDEVLAGRLAFPAPQAVLP